MLRLHEDPDRFREALNFTEVETTFAARLVEKDYYCAVLLEYLADTANGLVFKGGTCLAKVYNDFFRLSEDLDFVIPTATDSPRSERRKLIAPVKQAFAGLTIALPHFHVAEALEGANNSTQYIGSVGYWSLATGQEEAIKIEVGLREPLLMPFVAGKARSVVLDPLNGRDIVEPVSVRCMARTEAFAEKFRAALTRRDVAARDFFDLDCAVRKLKLRTDDAELTELVRRKLAVAGNAPMDVSDGRLIALRQRVEPQLRPVLRSLDFKEFDPDRAFRIAADMADRIGEGRG